jgi:hypothetical protein
MPGTAPATAQLLRHAYDAFNAHDVTAALGAMHPDVEWPDGLGGGYVHGHDAIRACWTDQWITLDPQIDPVRIDAVDDSHLIVAVHQTVRDRAGRIVAERFVEHAYLVEDGLIRRMDIRQAERGTRR